MRMRTGIGAGIVALLVTCVGLAVVWAVPFFSGIPNDFIGAGVAETAGYFRAADGTQAALWSYPGSEVSLTPGATFINLPQAAPVGSPVAGIPAPTGAILETVTVKDGTITNFGQELTVVMGGLFPTFLSAPGALDNGLAPGSTAGDGSPDQLAFSSLGVSYTVYFGPGAWVGPGPFPFSAPVFEIYDDTLGGPPAPADDLDIGTATTTLVEDEFDFDGAGPTLPI